MDNSSDSVWTYKPWWCQPWSILLTGSSVMGGSWLLFHRYWLTGLVSLPMLAWMGFFILVFPKLALDNGMVEQMKQEQNHSSP